MVHDTERKIHIGELEQRGRTVQFGIKEKDRSRHVYVIGQTGTGKSTLLEGMAIQDVQNGAGLIFMDPHGQSAEKILEYIPQERIRDTIYFAPHLQAHPIGLNIMEDIGFDQRHQVVSSLIASFHKIWGEGTWSSRMEYILTNTLFALLEYPDTTLLDIGRMYANKEFRERVVNNIKDPQIKKYWIDEYANYSERYLQDATPAIQNKVGQFTANPLIRNIIGQSKSAFNFREVIDNKKILVVNLSKGQIGEENAKILGVLFTTKTYLAALSRSELSRTELANAPPCNFYVDEFQSFANSSFAGILSEARKYKLNLILAHQYIGQLYSDDGGDGNAIRDAIFGNVGTFISFRVGPVDAEIIAKQFAPDITEEDLVSLPRFHIYLTLNIDGAGSKPFSARTLNIPHSNTSEEEKELLLATIIEHSGKTYGIPREKIEEHLRIRFEEDMKAKELNKKKSPSQPWKQKRPAEQPENLFKRISKVQQVDERKPIDEKKKPFEEQKKRKESTLTDRAKQPSQEQNSPKHVKKEQRDSKVKQNREQNYEKKEQKGIPLTTLVQATRNTKPPKKMDERPEKPEGGEEGWVDLKTLLQTKKME